MRLKYSGFPGCAYAQFTSRECLPFPLRSDKIPRAKRDSRVRGLFGANLAFGRVRRDPFS